INPSILLTDEIERDLNLIMQARPKSKIYLKTHPFIEAYLKKGFINKPIRWYMEHQKWIRIHSNNDLHLMEYKFFDDNEDEIRMKEIVNTMDSHTD
ncbi:MAG: hypothetical protein AAFO82_12335, partial [Bacteroidota bacterium]